MPHVAKREYCQEERSATMLQSALAIPASGLGGPIVGIHCRVVGMGVRLLTGSIDAGTGETTASLPIDRRLHLKPALSAARGGDAMKL